jgi:hypothetical protein
MHLRAISSIPRPTRFGNSDIKSQPEAELRRQLIAGLSQRLDAAFQEADSSFTGNRDGGTNYYISRTRLAETIIKCATAIVTDRKLTD